MSNSVNRKPAISRTAGHPADAIPERPVPAAAAPPATPAVERLVEQHNVRIRASVRARLVKAVDKLRYETGDRTISLASLTDEALDTYLAQRGC